MVIRINDIVMILNDEAVWNESIKLWSMDATGINGRKYRCYFDFGDQEQETLDMYDWSKPYHIEDITEEKR